MTGRKPGTGKRPPRTYPRREDVAQNGDELREVRDSLHLDLTDAAALIGCHPKALQHLENQTRGASDKMLRQIAKAYEVPTGRLRRPPEPGELVA